MRKFYVWNTGRNYSAQGQRIVFRLTDDGTVEFFDADRFIAGITNRKIPQEYCLGGENIADWLIGEYDRYRYKDANNFSPFEKILESVTLSGRGISSLQEVNNV